MKSAIIIIIIFSILAVSFTAMMINVKNTDYANSPQNTTSIIENTSNDNTLNNNTLKDNEIISNNDFDNETGLNLCSTYDEASIQIQVKEIDYKDHYGKMKIPQVSGLIDKRVESKINNDIQNSILDRIKSIEKNEGKKVKEVSLNSYNGSIYENKFYSMSNVFCLPKTLSCKFEGPSGDYYKGFDIYFNYELVNGNKLHLEDLFSNNYDVSEVVSNAINVWLEDIYNEIDIPYDSTENTDAYYDISSDAWKYYNSAWRNGERHHKGDYYDIEITEADIIKKYDSLYKNRDNFYFDNLGVKFGLPCFYEERYAIEFEDIPNKVVIYDKYKTDKSIFEDNSIGTKNILVCNSSDGTGDYYKSSFEDNLFYQYDIGFRFHYAFSSDIFVKSEYPISNEVLKNETEFLEIVKNEIDKYKKLSQSTNKAYILFFSGQIIPERLIHQFTYAYTQSGFSNILQCKLVERIIECDKNEYDKKLLQIIKLSNDNKYYGFWSHNASESFAIDDTEINYKEQYLEQYYYDTAKNKKYNSYEEIEKDDIIVLSPIFLSSDDYLFTYHIDNKIEEQDYYIEDVKSYDIVTLNRAYNELFARHGHDFKNQELKEYFELFDWYKPVKGKTVSMNELTDIEKENAKYFLEIINWRKNNPEQGPYDGLYYNYFDITGIGGL